MPTTKKRINITVNENTYAALVVLSEKHQQSVAGLSLDLLEQALEFQEDIHFSRLSDARVAKKEKRISHDKAWE